MAAYSSLFSSLRRLQITNDRRYYPQYNFKEVMMAKSAHSEKSIKMWQYGCYFIAFPSIIVVAINTYFKEVEHLKHPRPEFINYDHLYGYSQTKPYPWGDGKHTLFHNPRVNALKDIGYEVPDPNAKPADAKKAEKVVKKQPDAKEGAKKEKKK